MLLLFKNYFEVKAFEFLKYVICLKAEPPKRTQKPSLVINLLFGNNFSLLKAETLYTLSQTLRLDYYISYPFYPKGSIYLLKMSFLFAKFPFPPPFPILN